MNRKQRGERVDKLSWLFIFVLINYFLDYDNFIDIVKVE